MMKDNAFRGLGDDFTSPKWKTVERVGLIFT